ncbi:MAG: hypothetical protein ACXAC7_14555 [Candidatus Hodarchaeales archaeon]|jgi:hypothetical protein
MSENLDKMKQLYQKYTFPSGFRKNFEKEDSEEEPDFILAFPSVEQDALRDIDAQQGDEIREEETESSKSEEKKKKKQEQWEKDFQEEWRDYPAFSLIERPFLKRNAGYFAKLIGQTLLTTFAFTFAFSFPLFLQLIPIDIRIDLSSLLKPLEPLLTPITEFFNSLQWLFDFFANWNPLQLYMIPLYLMNLVDSLTGGCSLSLDCILGGTDEYEWDENSDPDRPKFSGVQAHFMSKFDKLLDNPLMAIGIIYILISIPTFLFLCRGLVSQIIELLPEEKYQQYVYTFRTHYARYDKKLLTGTKYNRIGSEKLDKMKGLKFLFFISRFGTIIGIVLPILIGFLFIFL